MSASLYVKTPQVPHETATSSSSSAPFVIHIEDSEYANNNSALQRIPVDTQATSTTKKSGANAVDKREKKIDSADDLCGCCHSCSSMCVAWCLSCVSAGSTLMRVGSWGIPVTAILLPLYVGAVALFTVLLVRARTESYTTIKRIGYHYYDVTHYIKHNPEFGLMLGAFICAFVFCAIVGVMRTTVRYVYCIPSYWVSDLLAAL